YQSALFNVGREKTTCLDSSVLVMGRFIDRPAASLNHLPLAPTVISSTLVFVAGFPWATGRQKNGQRSE
ncbi:MAG: hypothetical protein WBF93_19280, partial [Pirellulales bacterium]